MGTPRVFLSELQCQLEHIDKRIRELEDDALNGALSPRFLAKDRAEANKLIARRKLLRYRIIHYEP